LRASARVSRVALRSLWSPMAAMVEDGGCAGGGWEVADWELEVAEEERLEADTRLSRASNPRVAGPRLRSSWP
jgi:hypothetical protein